ncbi:MARCKS-related protein [Pteropus alecto]|uniref:MARCKS-related protein n=1 Tax=Pteropus alecto TaxID=9402 RepID=L5K815_PTEAL|nr:MARCKS-related protein [Pteropus alecto]
MEPVPTSQGTGAKGDAPAKETPKKKKFSFKKAFKLSGLSFKRNWKEGGSDSSASSPTEEEQEQGEIGACIQEGIAQEGRAATSESQEPQAKGAEASAASRGGDTEEEAGTQAAELSTPSGRRVALHLPASRMSSWVGDLLSCKNCAVLVTSLPGHGALATFLCPEREGALAPSQAHSLSSFPFLPVDDSPVIHSVFLLRPVEDGPLQFPKLG